MGEGRRPSVVGLPAATSFFAAVVTATRLLLRIAAPAGVRTPAKQLEGAHLIEAFIAEALVSNDAGDLRGKRARISSQAGAAVFLAVAAVVLRFRSTRSQKRGDQALCLYFSLRVQLDEQDL